MATIQCDNNKSVRFFIQIACKLNHVTWQQSHVSPNDHALIERNDIPYLSAMADVLIPPGIYTSLIALRPAAHCIAAGSSPKIQHLVPIGSNQYDSNQHYCCENSDSSSVHLVLNPGVELWMSRCIFSRINMYWVSAWCAASSSSGSFKHKNPTLIPTGSSQYENNQQSYHPHHYLTRGAWQQPASTSLNLIISLPVCRCIKSDPCDNPHLVGSWTLLVLSLWRYRFTTVSNQYEMVDLMMKGSSLAQSSFPGTC